mmetsp:Transcript_13125/g.24173  ORF Transcript_13125/g.24173 Transcript_13125/m.24173 type:complete len:233 (+) Transcript_13125:144-842(+)
MLCRLVWTTCALLRIYSTLGAVDWSKGRGHPTLSSMGVDAGGTLSLIRRGTNDPLEDDRRPDDSAGDDETSKVYKPETTGSEEVPPWCLAAVSSVTGESHAAGLAQVADSKDSGHAPRTNIDEAREEKRTSSTKRGADKELLKMIDRELPMELTRTAQLVGWTIVLKIGTVMLFIILFAFLCGVPCTCLLPFKYNQYVSPSRFYGPSADCSQSYLSGIPWSGSTCTDRGLHW